MDNSKQYQYIPEPPLMRPTVKQVEEYMAGLNGTTKEDIQCSTCKYYTNSGLCGCITTCKSYNEWKAKTEPSYDIVSKPKHYMLFDASDVMVISVKHEGIEVRDVIEKLLDKLAENTKGEFYSYQYASDYVQLMQYLMRFMDKNGVEDLKKARWYLDKMIESY